MVIFDSYVKLPGGKTFGPWVHTRFISMKSPLLFSMFAGQIPTSWKFSSKFDDFFHCLTIYKTYIYRGLNLYKSMVNLW